MEEQYIGYNPAWHEVKVAPKTNSTNQQQYLIVHEGLETLDKLVLVLLINTLLSVGTRTGGNVKDKITHMYSKIIINEFQ